MGGVTGHGFMTCWYSGQTQKYPELCCCCQFDNENVIWNKNILGANSLQQLVKIGRIPRNRGLCAPNTSQAWISYSILQKQSTWLHWGYGIVKATQWTHAQALAERMGCCVDLAKHRWGLCFQVLCSLWVLSPRPCSQRHPSTNCAGCELQTPLGKAQMSSVRAWGTKEQAF